MATDYTEKWPELAPEWCDDEIGKAVSELTNVATPPTDVRGRELEQRIAILKRVKADYEAMFGA